MKTLFAATTLAAALFATHSSAHNLQAPTAPGRWAASVERALDGALQYPTGLTTRAPVTAEIGFTVAPDGAIARPTVTRSSGSPAADEAALEAVRSLGVVAVPPVGLAGRPVTYRATFTRPTFGVR